MKLSSYPGPSVNGKEKVRGRGKEEVSSFSGKGQATSWAVLQKSFSFCQIESERGRSNAILTMIETEKQTFLKATSSLKKKRMQTLERPVTIGERALDRE